jgi:hypothetical protein
MSSKVLKDAEMWREKYKELETAIHNTWTALGITTWEQAEPYAIWEHVEKLKNRADALEEENKRLKESQS